MKYNLGCEPFWPVFLTFCRYERMLCELLLLDAVQSTLFLKTLPVVLYHWGENNACLYIQETQARWLFCSPNSIGCQRENVFVQYSTKLICMIYCFWRLQYLAPGNTNLDRKHGTVLFLFGKKLAWSHRYISNYYYQILYSIAFWFNAQLLHLVGNIEFYNVNWWEILWNKVNTNWNQLNVTI